MSEILAPYNSFVKNYFVPAVVLICAVIIIAIIIKILFTVSKYKKSTYYRETGKPFFIVRKDIGCYGEYLTYKYLTPLEKENCRFLFNVYLPKNNSETSELDVVAVFKEGIFVFESKNYSGWIFGNETQKNWTQVLPNGKGKSSKEHFYNPILQNAGHIKWLKNIVGEEIPVYSVIVFSERCTFKKLEVSGDVPVIKRNKVLSTVKTIKSASDSSIDVEAVYNKLKPYTNVSDKIKQQHIDRIKKENEA